MLVLVAGTRRICCALFRKNKSSPPLRPQPTNICWRSSSRLFFCLLLLLLLSLSLDDIFPQLSTAKIVSPVRWSGRKEEERTTHPSLLLTAAAAATLCAVGKENCVSSFHFFPQFFLRETAKAEGARRREFCFVIERRTDGRTDGRGRTRDEGREISFDSLRFNSNY